MKRLYELRQNAGLTQRELARKIGVDRTTVTKWENGGSAPAIGKLHQLAAALNCTIAELVNEDEKQDGKKAKHKLPHNCPLCHNPIPEPVYSRDVDICGIAAYWIAALHEATKQLESQAKQSGDHAVYEQVRRNVETIQALLSLW